MFRDPLILPSGETDLPIAANEYPENIKAIGSTGRTNLPAKVKLEACEYEVKPKVKQTLSIAQMHKKKKYLTDLNSLWPSTL